MKARFYLAMAAAALLMSNCSQEEPMAQSQGGTNTLTATIEGASRSAVTDAGVFSWTAGDAFSVYNGEDFTTFTLSSGNVFTSNETITPSGVAIYPAGSHTYDGTTTKVNMATSYSYGSTNAPMVAQVTGSTLEFKHVGGLMRFIVKGMPSTATSFTFTANSGITGGFDVTENSDGENIISAATATNENKTVTINFESSDIKDVMTFYIPLPTGTYSGYTVNVGGKSHTTETTVENTINRGTLMLMPTFTYVESEAGLQKGEDNMVVLNDNENVSLTVADGENVAVAIANGAEATLNLTAPENSTEGLTISDGSEDNTESSQSQATLNVAVDNAPKLDINTPTLTVNLASGTYGEVTAKTATSTLVVSENVIIEKLTVNGGNIKLNGNATINSLTIPADVEMTIDLNGKTLSLGNETISYGLINRGNLTITNGTINFSGDGSNGAAVCNMSKIQLESVNVTSNSVCFRNWGDATVTKLDDKTVSDATVTAVINGGTFTSSFSNTESHSEHRYAVHGYFLSNMTMTGSTVTGSGGISVDVSFATLTNVTATANCQYGAHDLYVAAGNATVTGCTFSNIAAYSDDEYGKAVVNGTTYENGTTGIGNIADKEALTNAFTQGGSYILTDDVTVDSKLSFESANMILDLGGKTLKIEGSSISYGLINKGNMTIKNGTIAFVGDGSNGAAVCNMSKIQLESVNVTSNSVCFRNWGDATVTKLDDKTVSDATVTAVINGGTFTSSFSNTESHSQHRYAVHGYFLSNMTMTGSTVTGSGGISVDVSFATLTNVTATANCQYGAHDLYVAAGNATVTGCTFANAAAYSDATYGNAVVNNETYEHDTNNANGTTVAIE